MKNEREGRCYALTSASLVSFHKVIAIFHTDAYQLCTAICNFTVQSSRLLSNLKLQGEI